MAEVEAKHRKPGAAHTARAGPNDDAAEEKEWAHKTAARSSVVRRLAACVRRRWVDVSITTCYYAIIGISYYVADYHLLQPPDAAFVYLARPFSYLVFACFNLSWCSILFYGPGRPPVASDPGQGATLPRALADALNAGRLSRRGFCGEESFCAKCANWKPPLAHHCKNCGRCSLWMDHHCNFVGQCIGFRNMRCFFVWSLYGLVLIALLAVFTARYVVLNALTSPAAAWLGGAAWVCYLAMAARIYQGTTWAITNQLKMGFTSKVLGLKFGGLLGDARALEGGLQAAFTKMEHGSPQRLRLEEAVDDLRAAIAPLHLPRFPNMYWGPFKTNMERAASLTLVFGSPPSWRWLLPLVPGGTGSPLQPPQHVLNLPKLAAWGSLGPVMEEVCGVLAEHRGGAEECPPDLRALLEEAAALRGGP